MVCASGLQVPAVLGCARALRDTSRVSFCINYIIGVGILAVPYAFTQAGPVLASVCVPCPPPLTHMQVT